MPPKWANESLKSWEDAFPPSKALFVTHEGWTGSATVNVFQVVGTRHEQYRGKTWLEFLMSGERMQPNLGLLNVSPGYYLQEVEREPAIHYLTTDGMDFYVGADGNHRTCLARFFLEGQGDSMLRNVVVHHYKVDEAFHRLYRDICDFLEKNRLPILVEPKRKLIRRVDSFGWKVDIFDLALHWRDLRCNGEETLGFLASSGKFHSLAALTKAIDARKNDHPGYTENLFGKLARAYRSKRGPE